MNGLPDKSYDSYVLLSALQKYIRRGETTLAQRVALKLWNTQVKPLVSALFNRLGVIANEDIGMANIDLCYTVCTYVADEIRDLDLLMGLIRLMCESEKTRLSEELWFVHGRNKLIEHEKFVSLGDSGEKLIQAIDSKAYGLGFYHLYSFLMNIKTIRSEKFHNKHSISKGKTKCPSAMLWAILSDRIQEDVSDVLSRCYYSKSEKYPYIWTALMMAMESDLAVELIAVEGEKAPDEEIVLLDYIYDKHTSIGKKMGRGFEYFMTEGIVLNKQSEAYFDDHIHSLYISIRE